MRKLMLTAATVALTINQGLADPTCLVRNYDRAHLARHPQQTITSMTLLLDRDQFTVAFKLRGSDNVYAQAGYHPKGFGAGSYIVECDGGGLDIRHAGVGPGSEYLVSFERIDTVEFHPTNKGGIGCMDGYVETGLEMPILGAIDNSPVRLAAAPYRACAWLDELRESLLARMPRS